MKIKKFIATSVITALMSASASAAYMPSPTHAKGDRVRIKGESGIEIDAEYNPDMTIQFGTSYGRDLNNERVFHDHNRYMDRTRNEGSVYIQAVVPITFGERKKPDANRLYEMELQNRQLQIDRLEAEVALMRAAFESGASGTGQIFDESALQ